MHKLILIFSLFFMLGCSLKPSMLETNTSFEASNEKVNIHEAWWEDFEDENLNNLIQLALKNNYDLMIAYKNLQKSMEVLNLSNADNFPIFSMNANAERSKNSNKMGLPPQSISNAYSLSGILSYEIDIWGRIRNSSQAAKSEFKATKFDYEGVKISLIAQISKLYFHLLSLKSQKNILEDTIKNYEESTQLRKIQFDEGLVSNIIYLQSLSELQSAKVKLYDIDNVIDKINISLAFFASKNLNEMLEKNIDTKNIFPKEPNIPSELSSDILTKRPDIASSYERLKSTNFLVGVARSEYFPSLSLTGKYGYQSKELDDLFLSNAATWGLGANLLGKVFDFGRTKSKVKIAKLNEEINLLQYEKIIKTALKETRTALNQRKLLKVKEKSLMSLYSSQDEVYKAAVVQFAEGYVGQIELLDAQRNFLNTKLQIIDIKFDLINSIIDIYKSFGGGFNQENNDTDVIFDD